MQSKKLKQLALLLILTAVNVTVMNAQTTKKSLLLEGSVGNITIGKSTTSQNIFSNSKHVTNYSNINLSSKIGYFFTDNLVGGLQLDYNFWMTEGKGYYNNTLNYTYKGKSPSIGVAPFVRYYFNKNTKNRFYAQLSPKFNYQISNYTNTTYNNDIIMNQSSSKYNYSTFGAEGLIGYNHFFTSNVAFNTAIGYNYGASNNANYKSTFNNFVWNFGISVLFPRKEKKEPIIK